MGVRVPTLPGVRSVREPAFRGEGQTLGALCCGAISSSLPWSPSAKSPPTSASPGLGPCAEVLPAMSAEQQAGAARWLVERFCEDVPVARVAPSKEELEGLWHHCSRMRRAEVVSAFSEQLSKASSDHDWRTQVRVLHFLLFLYTQGAAAKTTAQALVQSSVDLIKHLSTDARADCAEPAAKVILLSQLSEAQIGDLGGLLSLNAKGEAGADRAGPAPAKQEKQLQQRGGTEGVRPPRGAPTKEDGTTSTMSTDLLGLPGPSHSSTAAKAEPAVPMIDACDLMSLDQPTAAKTQPALPEQVKPSQQQQHPQLQQQSLPQQLPTPSRPAIALWERSPAKPTVRATLPAVRSPAAKEAASAQWYNISAGDWPCESPELDGMFSFKRQQQLKHIPLPTETYMREHFKRPQDPFAFVDEHMWQF